MVTELIHKDKPIDFVSLKQVLKNRDQLEEIGGKEYLSALYSFVPCAVDAGHYLEQSRRKTRFASSDSGF